MSIPHAVQFYDDDVFLIDAVSAFIAAGIKENATIIVIATDKHHEEIRNALQASELRAVRTRCVYLDAVELLSGFHGGGVAGSRPISLRRSGALLNGPL